MKILCIIFLCAFSVLPYDFVPILNELTHKSTTLKWIPGYNQKFFNMSLQQIKSMMGTPLPIDPNSRLP